MGEPYLWPVVSFQNRTSLQIIVAGLQLPVFRISKGSIGDKLQTDAADSASLMPSPDHFIPIVHVPARFWCAVPWIITPP